MNGTLIRAGTMMVDGEELTGVFVETSRDEIKWASMPIGKVVDVIQFNKPSTPVPAADGCAGCRYKNSSHCFADKLHPYCYLCTRNPQQVDHYEPTPPTGGKA